MLSFVLFASGTCCPSCQTCQQNKCVPQGTIVCGSTTCMSGQTCQGSSVCCNIGENFCSGVCCASGLSCVNKQCVPQGSVACGSSVICPANQFCGNAAIGLCCRTSQIACGNQCCPTNQQCNTFTQQCAPAGSVVAGSCAERQFWCPTANTCCPVAYSCGTSSCVPPASG